MSDLNIHTARAVVRKCRRELARRDFLRYCEYIYPNWITASHHYLISDRLEKVRAGEITRLQISMPPRHGKSLMASILFPAFWLAHNPGKQIIHISYAAALSNDFSRQVRQIIRDDPTYHMLFPAIQLDPDRQRVDDWKTTAGGGFKSVGVQGGVTGHGADLMIIDDPTKEGDEQSPATLEAIWAWFMSAARTRLAPGAAVVEIMTRWHPLDLMGRQQELECSDKAADQWEKLVLPALALDGDLLGREPGEALWPERFAREDLLAIKALSERYFESLFQQNPSLDATALFRAPAFKRLSAMVAGEIDASRWIWTFDLAFTDKSRSDYNVFGCWWLNPARNRLYLREVYRFRAEWPEVRRRIIELVDLHPDDVFAFPKHQLELLAVQTLKESRPDARVASVVLPSDKKANAAVFAQWVAAGRVYICEGRDGNQFISEHSLFPDAAPHDDCVDCSSVITHYLGLRRVIDILMVERSARRRETMSDVLAAVGG